MNRQFTKLKGNPILKGFYVDNYHNRKLGRVGQEYDVSSESSALTTFPLTKKEKELPWGERGKIEEKNKINFVKANFPEDIQKIFLKKENLEESYMTSEGILSPLDFQIDPRTDDVSNLRVGLAFNKPEKKFGRTRDEKIISSQLDLLHNIFKPREDVFTGKLNTERYYPTLVPILKKYNNFETKEDLIDFIKNSPRTEFYKAIKYSPTKGMNLSSSMQSLLYYRFILKYNKFLVGEGWHFEDKNGKFVAKQRDLALGLASQIEFGIENLSEKDKKYLIVDNPNFTSLVFDKDQMWNSCYYTYSTSTITITENYVNSVSNLAKGDEKRTVNQKEKYFLQTFFHELGHSLEKDFYNGKEKEEFKDFANHLGWKDNLQTTIFLGVFKDPKYQEYSEEVNLGYYSRIVKDNKEQMDKIKSALGKLDYSPDKATISRYSNKSASEAFAEYFGYYVSGSKKIDEEIAKYKKDPDSYYKNSKIESLFPYSAPQNNLLVDTQNKMQELLDNQYLDDDFKDDVRKTYKFIIDYNMEAFIKIRNILDKYEED